jgi:alpha-tubulin suppressor-like RCC1 family protein
MIVLLGGGLAACGSNSHNSNHAASATTLGAATSTTLRMPAAPAAIAAAGGAFTVVKTGGRLLAWGSNASGEVGDGSTEPRRTPTVVTGITAPVVAIASGAFHTLALTSDGSVYAWGHNHSGELGDGTTKNNPTPTLVPGLHDVRAVAAGAGFSLALEADGSVLAWGNNQSGELGDGKAPQDHTTPALVRGLGAGSGVVEIAAGADFGMVRKADGSVSEWGNGTSGQLGDSTTDKQSAPTPVHGLGPGSHVVAIAGGGAHALALGADGSVLAWGNNRAGELGDGSAPDDKLAPVPVSGLGAGSGVVAISAGGSFSLAATRDGKVYAWGNNRSGELGDGNAPTDRSVPGRVPGLPPTSGLHAIAGGGEHCVAIANDGSVWVWGNNRSGQLGDGRQPTDSHSPVQVSIGT